MGLRLRKGRVGPSGFGARSTAEQVLSGLDLTGRRYLVTGSNSGLGLETVRVLASHGATVLAAARTKARAADACARLRGEIVPMACELSDPASVRGCVAAVQQQGAALDGIITNAGIMAVPKRELLHGLERQFFINHIGHFILVTGLLDHLTEDGRVVSLSSSAHTNPPRQGIVLDDLSASGWYSPWLAYGHSKLANLLFARELDRRLQGSGRLACAVHPGVIATKLSRNLGLGHVLWHMAGPLLLKSASQGAATQVWAAVRAEPDSIRGQYLADCNVRESSSRGRDMHLARKLWERSEEIVAEL